jgi:MYXO-CTERM domain-containing protein
LVTYNFTGGGVDDETVTGTFQPLSLGNGFASTADVSTPEAGSMATLGAGMSLLFALAARRRRT